MPMLSVKKLKVGFVFDDTLDSYDGVAQNVKIFGSWLSSQGHEVRYLVGETKSSEWAGGKIYSLSKNQKISFNGNQARIPLLAKKKEIKKILEKENFDILHVQAPYSPFMAQKVINSAYRSVAIVGTFHVAPSGPLVSIGGLFLRLMYGRSLNRFDHLFSVSSTAAHFAKASFGVDTEILPNVIELDKFEEAAKKVKLKSNNIVFLGRLVKRKGCKELIDAFNILYQYNKNARLVIGGKGPERIHLEEMVRRHDLKDAVTFIGFVEEENKPSLLAQAHIACFPSTSGESFGVSLLEAMAASRGVVLAGDNPGYRTILGKKPELLVNPKNSLAFAGRLSEMLENKETTKELQKWQQQEVKKYDIKTVGPKLVAHYRTVIAKRGSRADN